MEEIRFVGMMGKFSKVAQGIMMVHAKSAPVDFGFLARIAAEVGVPDELQAQIVDADTASQVGDWLAEAGYHAFFDTLGPLLLRAGREHIGGGLRIVTRLTTLDGSELGGAFIDG